MKRTKAKLEVKVETIRALSNDQLHQVAGGTIACVPVKPSAGCPSQTTPLCGNTFGSLACNPAGGGGSVINPA